MRLRRLDSNLSEHFSDSAELISFLAPTLTPKSCQQLSSSFNCFVDFLVVCSSYRSFFRPMSWTSPSGETQSAGLVHTHRVSAVVVVPSHRCW